MLVKDKVFLDQAKKVAALRNEVTLRQEELGAFRLAEARDLKLAFALYDQTRVGLSKQMSEFQENLQTAQHAYYLASNELQKMEVEP